MPFPAVPTDPPGGAVQQQQLTMPVVTPELAAQVQTLYDQYAMMGQQPPFEVPQVGADATEYLTNLYYADAGLATQLAEGMGMDRTAFLDNVRQVDQAAQANRGSNVFNTIGNLTRVGQGEVTGAADFFRDAALLGAIGYGTSFLGGGSGAGAEAAAGSTAAETFPYVAGGPVTVSAIPGVTAGTVGAAGAAAAAGGSGAAGNALTGAGAAGNALNTAGNVLNNIPPWVTDYLLPGLGALYGADAAGDASDAEAAAYQAAIDEQRRQFDVSRQDAMPWLTAGQNALGNLQNPNAFQASPGYEWMRSEGQRDIGNSFAARGGAASGNALRALSEFNTGLAAQDYNNWWNRQAGLAGVGQNTAMNLGSLGANTSANVGNFLAGQGASRASGVLGKYGAISGAAGDIYENFLNRRRRA